MEEDLNSNAESKDCGDSSDCAKPVQADPSSGNSCPAEDAQDAERDTQDAGRKDTAACPLNSDANLEPLESKEHNSCENQDGEVGEKGSGEKDPLCVECKMIRRDPSPKELVMYLHALRYKGTGFEYCSRMPEWAAEDWEE